MLDVVSYEEKNKEKKSSKIQHREREKRKKKEVVTVEMKENTQRRIHTDKKLWTI